MAWAISTSPMAATTASSKSPRQAWPRCWQLAAFQLRQRWAPPLGSRWIRSGNLYIPDSGNNRILFVNVSGMCPGIYNHGDGVPTSAAQTATVTNLGNQPLELFHQSNLHRQLLRKRRRHKSVHLYLPPCCPARLATYRCNSLRNPLAALSAGITVTNNTLNVAGSTQQVSVSGISFNNLDTTSTALTVNPAAVVDGQTATLNAVVSDTTTPATVPPAG